jgi:NAD(P)-dependent dehydrogenase (short-subunit alcohol dehydrogenase family)
MRLSGLNCVVTGGSSGIGAASVRRFVEEGAEVLIADIDIDAANSFAKEIGPAVSAIKCDVRIEAEVKAVADEAYNRWKKSRCISKQCWIGIKPNL